MKELEQRYNRQGRGSWVRMEEESKSGLSMGGWGVICLCVCGPPGTSSSPWTSLSLPPAPPAVFPSVSKPPPPPHIPQPNLHLSSPTPHSPTSPPQPVTPNRCRLQAAQMSSFDNMFVYFTTVDWCFEVFCLGTTSLTCIVDNNNNISKGCSGACMYVQYIL